MSAAPTTYANHLAMHRALDAAPALAAAGMGKSEQLVLIVIARHLAHGDQGTCWLGYETIGREAHCTRRWAIEAVGRLADAGIVKIVGRQGQTNLYSIDFGGCTEFTREATSPVNSLHPTSEASSLALVKPVHPLVKPVHPTSEASSPEVVPEVDPLSRSREIDQQVDQEQQQRLLASGSALLLRDGKAKATATSKTHPARPNVQCDGPATPPRRPRPPSSANLTPVSLTPSPESLLTARYYTLLGSPSAQTPKLAVEWPAAFRRLLGDHSYADLLAALEWALTEDDFWPTRWRRTGDSIGYLEDKLPTILEQSHRAKQTKKKVAPATPHDTPIFSDANDELAALYNARKY